MPTHYLPYSETGYFSELIVNYLEENKPLAEFYNRFPKLENFKAQLLEKQQNFSDESRNILADQITIQYKGVKKSDATTHNIEILRHKNTFTVTTGHQLNLFTGPLYFLYKIFDAINLAEILQKKYPEYNFVPIYWMATEDHDFEEINYFNFKGKKIAWEQKTAGAVGELETFDIESVFKNLETDFGKSENGKKLTKLFKDAYLENKTLTEATRFLANSLFAEYGLVILDGNDAQLKKAFIPFAELEISEGKSFAEVSKTTEKLTNLGYSEQVHPREINLFYLKQHLRERIIERDKKYYINDTDLVFSREELLKELNTNPERFSPNALLRPLYQEVVLPNLCYIGGGGELAYWFQLKGYFDSVAVPFPILLLRNSVLLAPKRISEKLKKLDVSLARLFLPQNELETYYTYKISEIDIDFSAQKEILKKQFTELYEIAKKTDASFIGAVGAQEKKQLNGLANLERRLLIAQKRKLNDSLERLLKLHNELFPNQNLQERTTNFSEFYIEFGDRLLENLKENLNPLKAEFTIFEL